MDDAVLSADLVEEDLDRGQAKAVGKHLAVVSQNFLGHPVVLEGGGEEPADRSPGGAKA